MSLAAFAQRVAILETVDLSGEVSYGIKMQVRSTLAYVISHNTGYDGYDRANVSVIFENPDFQRTGSISDAQVKELASIANAAYVLIAEASLYDDQNLIISAKLLDGSTGNTANTARPVISGKTPDSIEEACAQLADNLFSGLTAPTPKIPEPVASEPKPALVVSGDYVDLELPSGTLWKKQSEDNLYPYADAMAKFGSSVPSKEQWLELKNSCQWVWLENGYEVIGKNGQSIFLNSTVIMDCTGMRGHVGQSGWYWSSTPNNDVDAYCMRFDQDQIDLLANESHCLGYSVRLVK